MIWLPDDIQYAITETEILPGCYYTIDTYFILLYKLGIGIAFLALAHRQSEFIRHRGGFDMPTMRQSIDIHMANNGRD